MNNACVTIWKNARFGIFSPILIIISPNCLKVDRAMIFFISHSVVALSPAINIVEVLMIKSIVLNRGVECRNG